MKIAGLQKNSFVDYPGKIAAVVFTPGCNLNCYYCHNKILLTQDAEKNLIFEGRVFEFLDNRRTFLDAVVVSGGEPTLQPDLEEFLVRVKSMGFNVKLDTNGTSPEAIKKLADKKLLDYIAMDIKAPFDKYRDICGSDEYLESISQSIKIIMQGDVDYEFRTTFTPRLNEEDILRIADRIKGARLYVVQQFRNVNENCEGYCKFNIEKPHSTEYITTVTDKIKGLVKLCYTRGL